MGARNLGTGNVTLPSVANSIARTQDQLTGRGQSDRPLLAPERLSIHSEGRSFLVSTQTPEHSGISFDDQQRRVGLPMITSMKIEFFFGFLIGFASVSDDISK